MELRSTRLREEKENEGPDAKKACSQLTEVNHLKTVNHNLRTDIMVLVETKFDKIQQKLCRDLTLIMEKLA